MQTQVSSHSNQFLMNAVDISLKCRVFTKVTTSETKQMGSQLAQIKQIQTAASVHARLLMLFPSWPCAEQGHKAQLRKPPLEELGSKCQESACMCQEGRCKGW